MDPRTPSSKELFGFASKHIPWVINDNKWTRPYLPVPPPPVTSNSAVNRVPSEVWNEVFLHAIIRRGGKRPVTSYSPVTYRLERYHVHRVGISENLPKLDEFDCVNDVFLLRSICRVCRLWRATAVNSQLLWRYIRNDIPMHYVMRMFQRSGEQPLYADIEFDDRVHALDAECIQEILGRLSRIKTLKFDAPNSSLFSRYFDWLEKAAPVLENLALTSRPQVEMFLVHGQLPDVTILSKNVFNGCAPALRILLLENVVIPWDSQIFDGGNLTNLHLRFIPSQFQTPLSETLKILSRLQKLEVLEMISAGPRDTHLVDSNPGARLILPNLRTLSLQGMTGAITYSFMSKLCTPSLTFLDIRDEGPCPAGARYVMPSKFALPITEMNGLELNIAVVPGLINMGVYSVDDTVPDPKAKLVCKFTYKHGHGDTIDADVPFLLSALDKTRFTHNVVSLHIDINQANLDNPVCKFTPYFLHQLLWRMPQANLLRFVPADVKNVNAELCLVALCGLRGFFHVDGDAGTLVGTCAHAPTLRTVVFEGMAWDAMNVAKLVDWLRIRVAQNAKIERICFVGEQSLSLQGVGQFFQGIVTHCDFYA